MKPIALQHLREMGQVKLHYIRRMIRKDIDIIPSLCDILRAIDNEFQYRENQDDSDPTVPNERSE
jgi:hypothetical protein